MTDFAGLRKKLEEERAALAAFASRFDTMDCEVLEQRRQLEAQLTADLRKAAEAIAMLLDGARKPSFATGTQLSMLARRSTHRRIRNGCNLPRMTWR